VGWGKLSVTNSIRRSSSPEGIPVSEHFICTTCATQFAASDGPPARCSICEDERQYVGPHGQQWTTLAALLPGHHNATAEEEPGLFSIHTRPEFGIGQRAFLVQTPQGNLLWDCVPLLDERTIAWANSLGGISAIAVSHPHYYTTMVEWSRAFGDAPIYLHADDEQWVMRPDGCVHFWQSDARPLFGGLWLVRTGGHFAGYQVLLWLGGAGGRGVLLAGDQPYVCRDRRWVSFMYSYPNLIPLGPSAIRLVAGKLAATGFDRIYGAFPGQLVPEGAKAVVARSAERYLRAINDER
jgi:hypothetical protein